MSSRMEASESNLMKGSTHVSGSKLTCYTVQQGCGSKQLAASITALAYSCAQSGSVYTLKQQLVVELQTMTDWTRQALCLC